MKNECEKNELFLKKDLAGYEFDISLHPQMRHKVVLSAEKVPSSSG